LISLGRGHKEKSATKQIFLRGCGEIMLKLLKKQNAMLLQPRNTSIRSKLFDVSGCFSDLTGHFSGVVPVFH
jgi:hypothetical protein